MLLLDFVEYTNLNSKNETERAILLSYYFFKETGATLFSISDITNLMVQCGFCTPNMSRLRDKLTKGKTKAMLVIKKSPVTLEFIPTIQQQLEKEIGQVWQDTVTIKSNSELIDEDKFSGKRKYIDKLIAQINHSYSNNCYDACAVLMRRLFEIMLILTYQKYEIDDEIKDSSNSGYIMLDGIVKNAKNNSRLKLSRIKNEFDSFRIVGNFSAHSITYTAGKKDIDDIKLNYRIMLEELFNKVDLM